MNDKDFNVPTNPFNVVDALAPGASLGQSFEEVCSRVLEDIAAHRGLIVILGAQGNGKTELLHWLIKNLDSGYTRIPLNGTHLGGATEEAENEGSTCAHAEHALHKWKVTRDFVITHVKDGHEAVVLIDDAHALDSAVLSEFESVLEHELLPQQRVSIVLLGLPVLGERLSQHKPDHQGKNPYAVHRLGQLEEIQVTSFINDRMASADDAIAFPDETIDLIEHYSGGKPALVNTLCGWTFLLACRDGVSTVTDALVVEAAFRCGLLETPGEGSDLTPFPEGRLAVDFLRQEHRIHNQTSTELAAEVEDEVDIEPEEADRETDTGNLNAATELVVLDKTVLNPHAAAEASGVDSAVEDEVSEPLAFSEPPDSGLEIERTSPPPAPPSKVGAYLAPYSAPDSTVDLDDSPTRPIRKGPPARHVFPVRWVSAGVLSLLLVGGVSIYFLYPYVSQHSSDQALRRDTPALEASEFSRFVPRRPDSARPGGAAMSSAEQRSADRASRGVLGKTTSADRHKQEDIEALLAKAQAQYEAKKLTTPAGDNAWETYQTILNAKPDFQPALEGVVEIKERYKRWAVAAEQAGDFRNAKHLYEKALAVDSRNKAMLAWLRHRDTEGINMSNDRAEAAVSSPDRPFRSSGSRGVSEGMAASRYLEAQPIPQHESPPGDQPKLSALLAQADAQYEAKKLTTPAGDNALETYQAILSISPDFQPALDGIVIIKERYKRWAQAAEREGDLSQAKYFYQKALSLDSQDRTSLTKLREIEAQEQGAVPEPATDTNIPSDLTPVDHEDASQHSAESMFRIQIGAYESESVAYNEWQRVREEYPALLGTVTLDVEETQSGMYRVQSDALDETNAESICHTLQQDNQDCLVLSSPGRDN